MSRRFSAPSALAVGAVLFFLWAPLLQLGARSAALAIQHPELWRLAWPLSDASRGVWLGTLALCFLTALLATIFGLPVGFCLARGPRIARVLGAISCALPLGVPPVILAAPFVSARGVVDYPLPYAVLTLAMSFYPIVALATGAAVAAIPRGEEEAALLVSGPARAWFGVLGRRLFPAILGGAGAVAALCAWEMGASDLLGQPSFGMSVYRALNSPQVLAPGESAARAALTALPVPLLALAFLLPTLRALRGFAAVPLEAEAHQTPHSRAWWGAGLLVLLISPGFILWKLLGALESGETTWNTIVANDDAIANTLLTATFSALVLTLGALLWLNMLRGWSRGWKSLALWGVLLPGLCAPVVLGVAFIEWWNRAALGPVYDSTLGMVLVGHAARFFPFAVALLWAPVQRLNPEMSLAAQNMGASPLRTLFSVQIPLLRPALTAVFATLWAFCAGELTVTVLVHGPGGATLTLPIFNLLHAGLAADVSALCLLLMMLCGTAMALALLALRPKS